MMEFLPIRPELVESLGWTLLHSVWQLIACALLLKLALTLVPAKAARVRYALASATLLLALVIPASTYFVIEPSSSVSAVGDESSTVHTGRLGPIATHDVSSGTPSIHAESTQSQTETTSFTGLALAAGRFAR